MVVQKVRERGGRYHTTDPLVYDSVTSGISDAEADSDNDGLLNIKEIEIGTEPLNADTDDDGLEDGREISIYKTDPLKEDTDEDGLSDGDEPRIGLDPSNPKTFNVPDAEYVTEQTISADSKALSEINTPENPYSVSIEYKGTGYAEGNLSAGNSGYSNAISSDMELGMIAGFSFEKTCNLEKAVLKYEIKEDYLENEVGTYAAGNDELKGLKRLGVFTFDEESHIIVPLVTEYDIENNTLYAETDSQGTYFLIDYEKWLKNWDIEPEDSSEDTSGNNLLTSKLMTRSLKASPVSLYNDKIRKTDVVFSLNTSRLSDKAAGLSKWDNIYIDDNNHIVWIMWGGQ